nr:retrovirus-related Pol polyprotein from transposon TNT 1-94 [Tanacetum cinerariifolium]
MISNMEENRFCYIPPRKRVQRLDYLHYTRKKGDGAYVYAAHADYYILLRSCARVAQLDVRTMHAAVLTFERRLNWLEKNIDHCLNDAPPYEACELCHDDAIMQNVSNDDEMIQTDDDLTKNVSIDDFVDLSEVLVYICCNFDVSEAGISVALDGDHDKISKVVAFLENFAPKSKDSLQHTWFWEVGKVCLLTLRGDEKKSKKLDRFADKEEVESECVVDVNSGAELSSPSNDCDISKPCSSSLSDVSLTEPYNKLPKQSNLDATDILRVLHLKYNELIDTSDHGKDLEKYLEYCKDVVFAEVELPFEDHEEDKLIDILGFFFSKERRGTTSRALWLSLEKAYASHSKSREYTLKTQLLRIEMQGDETPDAYLNRAQEYADALAAIGEPVKDKYLVMLVVSVSPIAPSGPQAFYGARLSNNNNNRCNRNNSRGNNNNRGRAMDNSEAYYGDDALHVGNVKNVQTDWGGEFRNLASFFSSLGIIHRRSCPHTSEQNDFVERRNRHVVETGLTLLAQACVPQRFWHYAFDTPVYLINRMPSSTSTNKSSFEHIFKRSPNYSFLRVFGCLCFLHLRPYNRHKMDFRSTPCVFLGYSPSHHGYRCLDISTERLYIARHVRFNETQFPFDISKTTSPPPSKTSPYYSSKSPYVIPTTDHPSPSLPRSLISSPSSVSHLSPTSQTFPEYSVTTSIPTPPPPPPITRQRLANLRQNPKQRVPYNPFANHATILPTTIIEPTSFTVTNNSPEWHQAMKEKLNETRMVLSLVTKQDLLQKGFGNNQKHVYMKQPPDFIDPQRPNYVCLLHMSLYGLKQVPRTWFERLSKALFDLGNNNGTIDNIISQLGFAFALKDLGPLNYFLGIEIAPHVSGIIKPQRKYILELLQSAGLSNCNLVSSPMVTSSSLSLDDSTAFSNPVKYQKVLGSLQYVTLSRPDIAFAVNKVLTVHGGFAIYLGSNLISWTAHKQRTVSRFSTVSEYKALADTVAELTWLQALLNELGIRSSSTSILWCDNLDATYLSTNPIFRAHTKHVEIDYHFVREKEHRPFETLSSSPSCSPHKRPRDLSKVKTNRIKKPKMGNVSKDSHKARTTQRMISNMEENRFCYIPPRSRVKKLDYLHYTRKKGDGTYVYATHADDYITFLCKKKNIDHCLKDAPSYEACELCHDDAIMQSVSNDDEMIQNDDDLTNNVSIDDFVDLS